MTNSSTVVAEVLSYTLIILLQKCEKLLTLFSKNINVFAIFEDRNFNVKLDKNFVKF